MIIVRCTRPADEHPEQSLLASAEVLGYAAVAETLGTSDRQTVLFGARARIVSE